MTGAEGVVVGEVMTGAEGGIVGAVGQAGYRRPVTAMDRWYLAHPRAIPPVIQTVIEGAGAFDLTELTAAVDRASAANPGTRLRRVGKEWVASGPAPQVRVVAGSAAKLGVADIPALHDPLPADGALCEVLWCPGTPAVLVFRASHAVMDGQGRSLWVADVFRALRGEELIGATSTVTELDVFAKFAVAADRAQPAKAVARCPSPLGEPDREAGARRTAWARRTVDGYHPGLVAKVATALTRAYGLDVARFAIAFDLRRHVPEARTTGNMVQTEMVDVAAGESWESLYERLLTSMADGDEVSQRTEWGMLRLPVPVLRAVVKLGEAGPAEKRRYGSVSAISHLDRLDPADLCTPAFEAHTAYSAPLLTGMGAPDVNLQECGGRTEITLAWRDGPGMAQRMDAVLDQVAEELSPARLRTRAQNGTHRATAGGTVVDLLRARVSEHPEAEAIRWPGGSMTFAELDSRSSVVAARLAALGTGRGSVVGLMADRTPATVAGLWGILKSGAAYLPLDLHHPDERLAGVLTDAGAEVCLVQRSHMARPAAFGTSRPVVIDELPADGAAVPSGSDGPASGDLAYVIYTSGSTGKPKGVEVEHGALANYVDWATRRFDIDAGTRFAVFSSLAFDLSNTALYLSILAGGSLVLVPEEPSHVSLREMLERSGANALKLTPSHLDLIGRLDLRPAGFRLLVVGGEQLRPAVVERAREQFGDSCRVFNHYGPTEATVGCVANEYRPDHAGLAVVPIGIPADNCAVHLLDARRRFVPIGDVGEIYLAGAQLARGYRGRPDLTRERFVRLADGTRAYRTGDLAKVLPTGEVEYVGRADDQVKVMGHRVEPAEVANVLEGHPGVRECVVAVRSAPHGGHLLCAYVVAEPVEPGVSAGELTEFVRERLPRYLVPAAIRIVPGLPRTLNGKIDLRALPDPFDLGQASDTPREEPDEDLTAIGDIWGRHLHVDADRLDGSADFHELGGTSVLLLAMLAEVSAHVVGAAGEPAFMAQLGRIVLGPTLGLVRDLAVQARAAAVTGSAATGSVTATESGGDR
jgi:amino acid adenylation domain-containing protein